MENSMSWQWPPSSLSIGEVKVVATVGKTASAFYSYYKWAPKCLLLLISTNLGNWTLKLGDGQKIELTTILHMDSLDVIKISLISYKGVATW